MSVFHLFPSDVMGDCIGVVFESQEGISQLSNWVTDGLKGVEKFGLEWGSGDKTAHEGKERFRDVACGIKVGCEGFESCHFAVCHFFAVAIIVGNGVEIFPWVIMGDVAVVKVRTKFLPDWCSYRMLAGLIL